MNDAEQRLSKMAEWASGVNEQLKTLQDKIIPDMARCDEISLELSGLYRQYADLRGMIQDSDTGIADLSHRIAAQEAELEAIEAQIMLDVSCEINGGGKPRYTNETMRRAAVTVATRKNALHAAALSSKRNLEMELAIAKATRASLDNAFSEYRSRTRALTAVLDNLTARISL